MKTFTSMLVFAVVCTLASPTLGKSYTVLHKFDDRTAQPGASNGIALAENGNIYGLLPYGFTDQFGSAFRLSRSTGYQTIHKFGQANSFYTWNPLGEPLIDANGFIYGTSPGGNSSLFRISPNGNFSILQRFPYGTSFGNRLTLGLDGEIFGITQNGGRFGSGSIFKYSSGTFETILDFEQFSPAGGITIDEHGNLYGTAANMAGSGFMFKWNANDGLSNIYTFNPSDGTRPVGNLTIDKNGNLFGINSFGGNFPGGGSIFKLSEGGDFTVLHHFNPASEGYGPKGNLLLDASGSLFGTFDNRGTGGGGVFRISRSGVFSIVHKFEFYGSGSNPSGSLINDQRGNLYGMLSQGLDGYGGIYRLSDVGFRMNGGVPEAPTWLMVIIGFGLIGTAKRKCVASLARRPQEC